MKARRFDCVAMKNAIQKSLFGERKGLRQDQVIDAVEKVLATSSAPAALFWRRLGDAESMRPLGQAGTPNVMKIAESREEYKAAKK